jgi:hypothetical protein
MLDKDVELGIIFHAASLNPDIGMRGNRKSGRISREIPGNRVLSNPSPSANLVGF